MEEYDYWLGFSVFPGIGPKKFSLLLAQFGTANSAWNADKQALQECLGKALTEKFIQFRSAFSIHNYKMNLSSSDVFFLTSDSIDYPVLLKESMNPPFVLYYKGEKEVLSQLKGKTYVAVVGTRKITEYGRSVTTKITEQLVSARCSIVSGLAFGVDACAHNVTLENEGKTIAVLGCGVNCCSPKEHEFLYRNILKKGGCIISEYPLSAEPSKGSFPSRNRIIAGLSHAVVVTEGAADSGSLYTAEEAFRLNRPVFAVPGPITSQLSEGPHGLIAKGGVLTINGEDILRGLQIKNDVLAKQKKHINGDTKEEQLILKLLRDEELHFDEILKKSKINFSRLAVVLSMMEMKGMIKNKDSRYLSI